MTETNCGALLPHWTCSRRSWPVGPLDRKIQYRKIRSRGLGWAYLDYGWRGGTFGGVSDGYALPRARIRARRVSRFLTRLWFVFVLPWEAVILFVVFFEYLYPRDFSTDHDARDLGSHGCTLLRVCFWRSPVLGREAALGISHFR